MNIDIVEFDFKRGTISKIPYIIPIGDDVSDKYGIRGSTQIIDIHSITDWAIVLGTIYEAQKVTSSSGLDENCAGHPDFKVLGKDGNVFYVECKQNGDGLKYKQVEWIFDKVKSGEDVRVVWFGQQKAKETNKEP